MLVFDLSLLCYPLITSQSGCMLHYAMDYDTVEVHCCALLSLTLGNDDLRGN